jgi:hypothetical protein
METLVNKGLPAYHFDCHTPILFNKNIFPEVIKQFNYQEGSGLTMKSLYGNVVYAESGKFLNDEKKTVFRHYDLDQLNVRLEDCDFMSFNDEGLNPELKKWLYGHFPNRSRWELNEPEDKILEIQRWANTGKDYQLGVKIFTKYFHGDNLMRMFLKGENEILRKKLEFKLLH